jgi:branched-chain amino acid transport system permease protein
MRPVVRSTVHALSFIVVLSLLAVFSHFADLPPKAPHALFDQYGHQILLDIGIAITLAVSLNLILGIAGQFSLGHAGFQAAGAFTAIMITGSFFAPMLSWLTERGPHLTVAQGFAVIMVVAMLAGALVAGILGLLVGLPTLRLRGDYLAIATLGFGEIMAVFFQNFTYNDVHVLGGSTGLSLNSMRNEWAGDAPESAATLAAAVQKYMDDTTYYVGAFPVLAIATMTIFIVHNIKYATSGRALLALREDPVASESVGVPTTRYKVAAFVIGAVLAGLAGGLVSHHKSLINPDSFRFMRSIEIVAMVIIGGQGSITGSIVAAALLTLLPEALRTYVTPWTADALEWVHLKSPAEWVRGLDIEKWRMVLYSAFLILAMLFRPQGLFGRYELSDVIGWAWRKVRPQEKEKRQVSMDLPPGVATLSEEREGDGASAPLLTVKAVTMQFGGLKAVDKFSLTMHPGELVGLIGPNGAGKTTVFNVLTGVYRPTLGGIELAGKTVIGLKPSVISRRGVARTFQNIRLFGNLSVVDNVQIAQHAHHKQGIPSAILRTPGFYREEAVSRRNARGYLDLFGLMHLADERANSLSYGDQRRLEIARALATRPKLLLLDEPAAGMNPTEKRELMEMIQTLRSRFGLTILLIEHDMKVIMGICQRIVVLDYGRTIAEGTPEEIRKNPAVIEAYLGASAHKG